MFQSATVPSVYAYLLTMRQNAAKSVKEN